MTPPANQTFADGVGAVTAANLNSMVQWCDTAAGLRAFIGLSNMVALLEGLSAVGDGGQGVFYWNSFSTAADDGVNIIKPSGVLVGAWIRIGTLSVGGGTDVVALYVSPTGSDANNGLTPATPFLTLQKAAAAVSQLSLGGLNFLINLANGTYTAGAVFSGPSNGAANATNGGGGQIIISGASPGGAIIADTSSSVAAIIALFGVQVSLQNVTISSTNGSAVFPSYSAIINIGPGVVIGACHFGQFHAETFGAVRIINSYTISGGAPAHLQAVLGGFIIYLEAGTTVTTTGTPAFSNGFAESDQNSVIYCNASFITFAGTGATGLRYIIRGNAIVETESGSATFLPGNAAGETQTGGQYLPPAPVSVSGFTGLGGAGTAITTTGSGIRGGAVQLTAASGAGNSGTVTIALTGDSGPDSLIIVPVPSSGTGSWASGAQVNVTALSASSVTLSWSNGGVSLNVSSTYFIAWVGTPLPP